MPQDSRVSIYGYRQPLTTAQLAESLGVCRSTALCSNWLLAPTAELPDVQAASPCFWVGGHRCVRSMALSVIQSIRSWNCDRRPEFRSHNNFTTLVLIFQTLTYLTYFSNIITINPNLPASSL
jgi:hypothetical protein